MMEQYLTGILVNIFKQLLCKVSNAFLEFVHM